MNREWVVCKSCGWESKHLPKEKALTMVCPYCQKRALAPK